MNAADPADVAAAEMAVASPELYELAASSLMTASLSPGARCVVGAAAAAVEAVARTRPAGRSASGR